LSEQRPILIVDDDEDIRDLLSLALELRGYRAVAARDGIEALEWLALGDEPAFVLLDMMMPRLDGEGFVAAVRREPSLRRIPIVLLSGHREVTRKAVELDTAGFLVKPIRTEELLAVVRKFTADSSVATR
jgi:CheY-like chemotaxis protein